MGRGVEKFGYKGGGLAVPLEKPTPGRPGRWELIGSEEGLSSYWKVLEVQIGCWARIGVPAW